MPSFTNGGRPHAISKSTQPIEYTSDRASTSPLLLHCSGDM